MVSVINAYHADDWADDVLVLHRPGATVGYVVPFGSLGAEREFTTDARMLLEDHSLPGDHDRILQGDLEGGSWPKAAAHWPLVAVYDDDSVTLGRTSGLPAYVVLYLEA